MLAAAARSESTVANLGTGADVESTKSVLKQLGVSFVQEGELLRVGGVGLGGFGTVDVPLDCGNSGTTMRLLPGLLAGTAYTFTLTGDDSLLRRPMERIAGPLRQMGVEMELTEGGCPPVKVRGGKPKNIQHTLALPSAQVKSAILMAALSAEGITTLHESIPSRDHTELMLQHLGVGMKVEPVVMEVESNDPRRRSSQRRTDERMITINGPAEWSGAEITVPGDFSTAAFFVAAGILVKKSDIRITGLGANPTRTGMLAVLASMGAPSSWHNRSTACGEPHGDLRVEPARLTSRKISGRTIPKLIDELPIMAVLATQAAGTTVIRDAADLRHKESDRIERMAVGLRKMGARMGTLEDGWVIEGPTPLSGAEIETGGDHRVAMSFAVAGLIADGETEIDDAECVNISCPGFFEMLDGLR
jgi:3-phosphoshikimate 1-carboxyvinyltransferase